MKASADSSSLPSTLTKSLIGRAANSKALGGPCGCSSQWLPSERAYGSYTHRRNCFRLEWATSSRLALSSRLSLACSADQSKQRQPNLVQLSHPLSGTAWTAWTCTVYSEHRDA